ncbi:endonuclease/exonuclease/phosphatase family protein [Actinomyces slackii]|uniref:Uncharacterized protein conserved in bacteria n=1 Tax=Actinomyces slackii TaxID=52774 RepID=A0A3S4SIY5_9ACTO|nr:endonuclease/exonuclease/phosphatase family protein [Actinomyces slackii]VEG73747.1 Uncharacterized protein conserved in bacteria [Actinomyces slackii]
MTRLLSRRALGWAVAALIALVALMSIWPPATMQPFMAQLIALRSFQVVGWALLGLAVLGIALLRRRLARPGAHRPGLRTGSLAAVLLIVALVHGGIIVSRGLSPRSEAPQDSLTVLNLNTEREDVPARDVATAATTASADIIVLTETSEDYGQALAGMLTTEDFTVYTAVGAPGWQDTEPEDGGIDPVRATTVLVASHLGQFRQVEGPQGAGRGLVRLEPVDGTGPVIIGAHTYPPVPGYMSLWRSSTAVVASLCQAPAPGLILVGDLNATRDHAPLRDLHECVSAGEQAGIGGLATWPTATGTTLMGATIDHVLIDPGAWQARSGEVLDLPGSDHRAVVVHLTERPQGH